MAVRLVEVVVVGYDLVPGECIHPECFVFKAQLYRIERTLQIAPVRIADISLVTVNQFLPAQLERHGKQLRVAQSQVRLVHIQIIGFGNWPGIAGRIGFAALDKSREPARWRPSQVKLGTEEEKIVAVVQIAREVPVRVGTGIVFQLVAAADFGPCVPGGGCREFLPKKFIYEVDGTRLDRWCGSGDGFSSVHAGAAQTQAQESGGKAEPCRIQFHIRFQIVYWI